MVAVSSTMQALGSPAHDFSLPNVSKENSFVSLTDFPNQPVLLMFICNHCPYVIHLIETLVLVANGAQANGFAVLAISSNDAQAYPQDGPEAMALFAEGYGFEFPYLFDQSQQVAKAYGAACTPDFYVYDSAHRLQYRGQMDGSRPSNDVVVDGVDLANALTDIGQFGVAQGEQIPSIGCNIKWRAGNTPDYF